MDKLEIMSEFATTRQCRRIKLRDYSGQKIDKMQCNGKCDNCPELVKENYEVNDLIESINNLKSNPENDQQVSNSAVLLD